MPAQVRMHNGLRASVHVCDISTHGLCFVTQTLFPVPGMWVAMYMPGLEALGGEVRWVHEKRCGVLFERPMYEPVVDHLCRQFPPLPHGHRP